MAKSRNNLLGVGGQRRKLSRADQQGGGPQGTADRKAAADQKQELLRRMRERAQSGAEASPDAADAADGAAAPSQAGTGQEGASS